MFSITSVSRGGYVFPFAQATEVGSSSLGTHGLGKAPKEDEDSRAVARVSSLVSAVHGLTGVRHCKEGMALHKDSMAESSMIGSNPKGGEALQTKIEKHETSLKNIPLFQRPLVRWKWWKTHASKEVWNLIWRGVAPEWEIEPSIPWRERQHTPQEIEEATKILSEYQESGAVTPVKMAGTKYLVPWFIIVKQEGERVKKRLISDCRELNKFFTPKKFRLDNLQQIFPYLRKGQWAAKLDLKDAYFHLSLNPELQKFVRMKVGSQVWEFRGGCFGLSVMPHLFMMLMGTFEKLWRKKGFLVFVYLDDILLLGVSQKQVQKQLSSMVEDLLESGMKINIGKSVLEPTQNLAHLGFILDLKNGALKICPTKLKMVRKELGKLVVGKELSCRKMAAILGATRSFLVALPFLRAFTDTMVGFVNLQQTWGWDHKVKIPETLKAQLVEIKKVLEDWQGRKFCSPITQELHSDSSDLAWGGLDLQSGAQVQEFWRHQKEQHINQKELIAAVSTVQSLAKPGGHVQLSVDNTVAFSYLKKGGGKLPHFNHIVRPFLKWCMEKDVKLTMEWVPSAHQMADALTRSGLDHGDYTLDRDLFCWLVQQMSPWVTPVVDMFASPGNAQLQKFVSRWPHFQAMATDALKCPLKGFCHVYANPPWSIIPQWLHRLRENPHITCLMICPFWDSAPWWPQLIKLHLMDAPVFQIKPFQGMFRNCNGALMPAPKWPLTCIALSGKVWLGRKCHLRTSKISWK